MSAARSLERIAVSAERLVDASVPRVCPPAPAAPGILSVLIRSCPDPDLIRRVPSRWFKRVDSTAVVSCPCEHVVVCQPGWTGCEGCERTYVWSGSRLFAVKGGEPRGCSCSTVRREPDGFVCIDCGEAA